MTLNNQNKRTILVVDDNAESISMIGSILRHKYRLLVATNGALAVKVAQSTPPPDLILLDIIMPEIDGYTVCAQLKADLRTRDIPIIFITSKSGSKDEEKGFALGGCDYVNKPFSPSVLHARVDTHIKLSLAQKKLEYENTRLESELSIRTMDIELSHRTTLVAMASLAEMRDNDTGEHIKRTQHYVKLLATQLLDHPNFKYFLNSEKIEEICQAAPLHDIGKISTPDYILLKPGELTVDEFEIMKQHTTYGGEAIAAARSTCGANADFLEIAQQIAKSHHEKWDGSGYPDGLAGKEIPIPARLMALADVYDALRSPRCYKPSFSHEKSMKIISSQKGKHFDPDIHDAFMSTAKQFDKIWTSLSPAPEHA